MSMPNEAPPALNPWTAIWLQPRATLRRILDDDPTRTVLLLAALCGIARFLEQASVENLGDVLPWPRILVSAIFIGPVGGIIGVYLGALLLVWTGRLLGGAATMTQLRAVLAWSTVPLIWTLPLVIPELALFGQEAFTESKPGILSDPQRAAIYSGLALVKAAAGIWTLAIGIIGLSEAQRFSVWRAVGNALLVVLVVAIVGAGLSVVLAPQGG